MIEKILRKKFIINLFLVFSIFLLDRFSKIYVISLSNKSFENDIFISKFLNITLIWNEGIAFGLFALRDNLYNILTCVILRCIKYKIEPIVCTSVDPNDDIIEKICHKLKVKCFRGSLENKLKRLKKVRQKIVLMKQDTPKPDFGRN